MAEKLCVAWELYGRLDIGDSDYSTLMWGAFELIRLTEDHGRNSEEVKGFMNLMGGDV